jgi:hypothetical protein
MRWVGGKIKGIHLDSFWWAGSSTLIYLPVNHVGAPSFNTQNYDITKPILLGCQTFLK